MVVSTIWRLTLRGVTVGDEWRWGGAGEGRISPAHLTCRAAAVHPRRHRTPAMVGTSSCPVLDGRTTGFPHVNVDMSPRIGFPDYSLDSHHCAADAWKLSVYLLCRGWNGRPTSEQPTIEMTVRLPTPPAHPLPRVTFSMVCRLGVLGGACEVGDGVGPGGRECKGATGCDRVGGCQG